MGRRTWRIRGRSVVTIGEYDELARLSDLDLLQFGLNEVGRVALPRPKRGEGLAEATHSQLAHAVEIARRRHAQEFALLIPWSCDRALAEILERLRVSPLPVRLYLDHKARDVLIRQKTMAVDFIFRCCSNARR